jgi:nucleoid DNA-binding protein
MLGQNSTPVNSLNPKTSKPVEVKAKKLPYFKVGKELKERVAKL